MSKTISICGVERGDAAYYLAVILSKATPQGNTVLVIDNSYIHDIYAAITDDDLTKKFAVKQNITYMKNVLFNKDYEGFFDYVVIWHGNNINEDILKNSDYIYVMPDYTKASLSTIKNKISDLSIASIITLRDSVFSNKLSEKRIADYLGIKEEQIKFTLVYDNKDYENYLAFLYNGRQTFGNLTPIYNEFLVAATSQILEVDTKEANKVFKRARVATGNK